MKISFIIGIIGIEKLKSEVSVPLPSKVKVSGMGKEEDGAFLLRRSKSSECVGLTRRKYPRGCLLTDIVMLKKIIKKLSVFFKSCLTNTEEKSQENNDLKS